MKIRLLFFLGVSVFLVSCSNVQKNKEMEYSLLRGVNYSQQNQYEKAIIEYQKAYVLDSNNVILLKEMGYCYYQFGDYTKAEEFWLKALKQTPNDESLIKNLATLYYENKDYSKVNNIIKNSYNPNDDYYLKLRALMLYSKNNKLKSYELLKEIDTEKFDVDTAIKYMEILKELDKRDELCYFMKNSYSLFKDNKEYIIAYAQNLSGVYSMNKEAQNILLDYIVINGNDNDIYLQLSGIYLKIGEKKKAEDTYRLMSY